MEKEKLYEILYSKRFGYCLITIACLLVYYPILSNKLLDLWDDQWVVMNVFTEGGLSFSNLWIIMTSFYHGQYAPFNEYLYLLLYTVCNGYNPFVFHLASLLLHIGCACVAYSVMIQLLGYCKSLSVPEVKVISLLAVLLFAVHPFNVEAVAWMSASKVLVYAFFYLLATRVYLFYLKQRFWGYYLLAIFLFICSFLGKEQAVTFPVWLLLLYWFVGEDIKKKRTWFEVLPFFLLAFLFGIITMLSQFVVGYGVLSEENTDPLWVRIIYACYAFTEYFFKCCLPFKLSYLYPFPNSDGSPLPLWLLFYPLLLLTAIVFLWQYIRQRIILFCILFFSIHIAISLHIIPLSRFAIVADRYAYISSLGICLLLSYGFVALYKRQQRFRTLLMAVCTAFILSLGIYANVRTRVWYDVGSLKKELRDLLKQRDDYKDPDILKRD